MSITRKMIDEIKRCRTTGEDDITKAAEKIHAEKAETKVETVLPDSLENKKRRTDVSLPLM